MLPFSKKRNGVELLKFCLIERKREKNSIFKRSKIYLFSTDNSQGCLVYFLCKKWPVDKVLH